MKRKLPFILLLSSILTLTACSDTEVSSNIPDKEGIAPYELSEKDHLDCSGHFSFETEPITFDSESVGSTIGFLESFENIELNAEIPVAVMLCDSGTRMPGCTPQDYFDPSKFEGIDFAQAVTLEFSD